MRELKLSLLLLSLFLFTIGQAQVSKTIQVVSSGTLNSLLTGSEKKTITNLTINGNLDARDFKIMRDSITNLAVLDISNVLIMTYTGTEGTNSNYSYTYPSNTLPLYSFYNYSKQTGKTSLKSVHLPKRISSIGTNAFYGCTGLASVYTDNLVPVDLNNNYNIFNNVNKTTCILYVPFATGSFYKAAYQWSDFSNIVENSNGFLLTTNSIKLPSNAGSATVELKANAAWTVSSNQSWLTVDQLSGNTNSILTLTAEANTTTKIRTGVITVSADGYDSQTIGVIQNIPSKTIDITAGGLLSALTADELNYLSSLTITGTMDARDFKTIRDNMPGIEMLDLSGVTVSAYTGTDGTYSTLLTYVSNEIPEYAFYKYDTGKGKVTLKTLKLPSTIYSISTSAINSCTGLTSIAIPPSINSIGAYSFQNCKGLTSIDIPASIKSIGYYAFKNCTGITSITVNTSIPLDLGDNWSAFSLNNNNCVLHVPYASKALYASAGQWNNFTNIVENAQGFLIGTNKVMLPYNAGSRVSIDVKSNVAWMVTSDQPWLTLNPGSGTGNGKLTFVAENNLNSIYRKAIVTVSAPDCITQTIEVTQSTVPRTINNVAGGLSTLLTADELNSISSITLTGTIDARDFKTMRDNMPLLSDLDLTNVTISAYSGNDGTSYYGTAYPSNTIPQNAFNAYNTVVGKKTLSTLKLPENLTCIGYSAFAYCAQLMTITIPSAVSIIEDYAFRNCSGLTSIYTDSSYPPNFTYYYTVFINVNPAKCTLYVPYKAKTLYANVQGWNLFTTITESSTGFITATNSLKIDYRAGSTTTTDISANVPWTVTSDQSWLTVSPASGTGDQKLTFTAERNDTTARRYAKVTISSPGFGVQVVKVTQSGSPKTITIDAGGLSSALTSEELISTTELTIKGTMDARDFKTLRDNLPELAILDLTGATIAAFTGVGGTYDFSAGYSANEIPASAFYIWSSDKAKTSLVSIKIPSSVTFIGSSAFENCTGLTSIYINSVYPIDFTNSGDPFYKTNKAGCTLYVPYATKPIYSKANIWKDFTNIAERDSGFLVESNEVKLRNFEGSTARMNVKSNIKWTVTSNQTWLKVKPISSIGNDSIIFTAEINLSAIIRTATVTVSAPGEKSQTINVTQSGTPKIIINNTAGELHSAFTSEEIKNVSELTIMGTINASDFYFMRDSLPLLTFLDISHTKIADYFGNLYIGYAANIIPWNAFYNSNTSKGKASLVSIMVPLTATGIFDGAFQSCTGLTDISIPSSIKTIGKSSFNTCTSLKEIVLPDSVSTLGESSFANCTKFKTVTIPQLVTSIGANAFMNCTGLTTINAQPDVPVDVSANWGVFYNVDKTNCILNVPLGKRRLYVAANQWKDFSNIIENSNGVLLSKNNLKLPKKSVDSITISVISNGAWTVSCDKTWLTVSPQNATGNDSITINVEDNPGIFIRSSIITVSGAGAPSKKIVVTQAATTKVVTVNAGELCSALTSEELRKVSDIKINGTIDARDFRLMRDSMPLLTYLDMEQAVVVTYNGNQGTLNNANNPYTIVYPDNKIPDEAFYRNDYYNFEDNLTSVIFPSTITNIGIKAFYIRTKLKDITIPNSVTTISERAFSSCGGLHNVNFGNSVSTIGYEAFAACNSITELVFPNSLKSIGPMSFNYCQNLINITFSNSITEIQYDAFAFCISLKSLKLPDSLNSIDYGAFSNCITLTNITFGNSLTTIGPNAFENCNMLNEAIIPNSVTLIEDNAFSGCDNLSNVKLSNSLIKLGSGAFQYCPALTSIIIPASVVTICGRVFDHSGIKTIYSYPVIPVVTIPVNEMFQEFDKTNCLLYVPIGSKSAYQTAYEWKDFTHIIEMPTDVPTLNTEKINIYLDPVSASFSIHGIKGTSTVSIYDLNGKAMLCKQVQPDENISIRNFPTGLYIVRIITREGTIEKKILKN